MKKLGKLIAVLLTAALAVTMFVMPASAAGISFKANTSITLSAPSTKKAVCYLKLTFSESGKAKFSIGSQKTTSKSKYEILNSSGKRTSSGKISALAGKELSVKNGTYYLKLTLQKGENIKKLKYTFTGKRPTKKTTGDWLPGYTLTDNETTQIKAAIRNYVWTEKTFNEGTMSESGAIDWLFTFNGNIVNPYSGNVEGTYSGGTFVQDPLGKYSGVTASGYAYTSYVCKIPEKDVDNIIYHLFGIKATHKVESKYWYYYNNYYYFQEGGAGNFSYTEYDSYEKLSDGRFLVKINYYKHIDAGTATVVHDKKPIYALVSVHKTDGKNYIRLHGVYKNKPSL